jgi:2-desacetyl-2-hydroxyethyl bacteriochlorophyllide A dehydrogenase
MRTAVISNPKQAELWHVDVPAPGPGELRVKLQGCGVCGSNAPVWEGRPWFQYPLEAGAPGHEGWGLVDEVASDIDEFRCGDRVAFLSSHAYADYDVTSAEQVTRLPDALEGMPFPAEALGCAMNAFARSGIRAGNEVAVIGIGFLGALLIRLAKNVGARVAAISRRRFALQVAEEFGADDVWPLTQADIRDAALRWTSDRGFDCVMEAAGVQDTLDLAGELAKERGRLVIAGYHQDGSRQVNMQMWNWKGLDVINAHEREPEIYLRGMRAAIDAVVGGRLDPTSLYTHIYPLEELSRAMDLLATRPDGFLKALVVP